MKNVILYIALIATSLMSCNEDAVENLTTISKDVNLTRTLEVRVIDGQPLVYTATETFDGAQNSDFSQFGNKIDNVTINSITYEVLDNTNYANANDASIVDGTLQFKKSDGTTVDVASITNLNIASALGTTKDMTFDQNAVDAMAAELKATQKVTTYATVQLDQPVSFDLLVTINATVSGSVVN